MLTEDRIPETADRRVGEKEIPPDPAPKPTNPEEEAALQNLRDVLDEEAKGSD